MMDLAFYFAWVDESDDTFLPLVHNREDEKVIDWKMEHIEGEFPMLSIEIKNPRIGLLAPGRKQWMWLSWNDNGTAKPIFFGRLVGIPNSINREKITLDFLARPTNYGVQKAILASSLRTLPYYDPVFIRPELWEDPDVVLEARTAVWHTDRITHVVTTSELIVGEDGTEEFVASEVPYASVDIHLVEPPIRKVRVTADVPWSQTVSGQGLVAFKNYEINSLAAAGVVSGWPKEGAGLGGGWSVYSSRAQSPWENLSDDDWGAWWLRRHPVTGTPLPGVPFGEPPFFLSIISAYSASVSAGSVESEATRFAIINDICSVDLVLSYEATRQRKDILEFELIADTQPILTQPDDNEIHEIVVSGNDVSLPDPFNEYDDGPILSKDFRAYFAGERGQDSIQYLLQLARASITLRSRAVQVTFRVPFERAVNLSCRKNARLTEGRLPGGTAVGKIVGYSIISQGGARYGEIVMKCCIGYGGAVTAQPGDPTYVQDGYVQDGYQFRANQIILADVGDVGYVQIVEQPNDDGLVFPLKAVPFIVKPHTVTTFERGLEPTPFPTSSQQSVQIDDCGNTTSVSVSSNIDTSPYNDWLSGIDTRVNFTLKPVTAGPFETVYPMVTTVLKLPKQIDLEAPSA